MLLGAQRGRGHRDTQLRRGQRAEHQRLAEQTARAKAKDDKDGDTLAKTPYAEAVRLQQRLFVAPGKYTLRLSQGAVSSETTLEVKAPEARKARAKPEPKLRGRDTWAHPSAEAAAKPYAEERAEMAAGK